MEIVWTELADKRKCFCRKGIRNAGIVHSDASTLGGGEDEASSIGVMVVIDMVSDEFQTVVELVDASGSGIIAPLVIVETKKESAIVRCRHTARLGGIVDGVNAGVEWKNLQDVSLGGDP